MEWRRIEGYLCDYFRIDGFSIEAGGGDTLAFTDNDTVINITELARQLAWEMADAA